MNLVASAKRFSRALVALALAVAALPIVLAFPSGIALAGPSPVFTMFIPFTEQQISDGLFSIYPAGTPQDVVTTIDITSAADNSIMYWDHWEDGYEADIANPVQATTEIWGDGNATNGAPPGVPSDLVDAGTIIFIQNTVVLPRNPATVLFDGRDKVASTRGFALSRAGWDTGLGTLHAGAVATTDLSKYGTQFAIPVGENIGVAAFDYTGVTVMASDDSTVVEFDTNGDGSIDQTNNLDEGESVYIDGGVNAGGTINSSKPIQAHLLTGERNTTYEGRWYELFPEEIWGDEYVAAAGSTDATQLVTIFLQNPGDTSITVAVDAEGVANDTNIVIAPGAVASYDLPNGSGAQFSSPGNPFIAVSATVISGTRTHWYDWGYSLVPTSSLTPGVVVGWGKGNPSGDDNNSPVWIAPLADTTLYVDVDGDAVVDQTIPNVNAFESVQIVDLTDNDMTGARVYTVDGTLISAAWGQDPALNECCDAYDLGTAVLPTTSLVTTKTAAIVVDVNGDGNLNPGDTLEYTIRSVDAGALSLTNVRTQDVLPSTLTYVLNSTVVDGLPYPDDTSGTPFPLDGAGVVIPVLAPGASADITFRAELVNPFPPFVQTVRNSVITSADQAAANATSIVPVVIPDLYIGKTSNAPGPLLPGQVYDYDIEVSNIDVGPQTGIDVTDTLPSEVTWQATTVTRWIDDPSPGGSDVLDDPFDTQAYDNNPTEWVTDWVETDAGGGGASGGDVLIISELGSNRLRLRGGDSAIRRSFDGAAWDEATLSYDYRPDSLEAGDWVSFQISTTGGSSWIELDRVIGPLTSGAYSPITYDMTRYLGQDIDIRWVTSPGFEATTDSFYIDDVEVAVNDRIQEVVPGGAPPNVYTGGELLTGESLTVNVSAQVDLGIDPTTDTITNVATAVSAENTTPVVSQATDPIARATVGDTVWHDQDGDGVVDAGEPRLSGVTVSLSDGGGPIATDTTDASGNYLFTDLDPGNYTVAVTAGVPAGMATTFDADGGYDETTDVTLGFGEDNTTTDFGYAIPVAVGDRVFADVDGDGVENGNDFGIDGLTVTITGPSHPTGTTTTTSSGTYGFSNLLPGTYTVDVDTSPLSTAAYSTTGGDSQIVVLTSGNDDLTVDFGYVLPAAIGDRLWHDLDADGVQDAGEPGFVGVDVTITGPGLPPGGLTRTTDATGYYLFADLDAGTFTVTVGEGTGDLPVGYDSTTGGLVQVHSVLDDEIVDTADFGFYTQATIGDWVFDDTNGNGVWDTGEPGLDNVPIVVTGPSFPGGTTIFTSNGNYDVTVDPGTYTVVPDTSGFPVGTINTLDGASPNVTVQSTDDIDTADFGYAFPAFIGDFVFHDLDDSGSWDVGEPGLGGVELTLTGGSLPPAGITTTTAGDGTYLFTNLAPGTYAVNVNTATVPAGYVVSTGGDGIGGIVLTSGASILGIDFGYRGTADVGDLIFHDLNDDGDWDAGEPGLPGVDVTITGGSLPPAGLTDTTDGSGNYLFTDLDPGSYTVTVDTLTVPAGYTITAGSDSRNLTLVSDADDLTLDFGYATTATIGDFVFDDLDGDGVQDPGEPGFDGVTVTLDDGASPPVTQDTVNGAYDFTVDPGTYTITVDIADLPAGAVNTLGGASQMVTVVSDEDENDVDFGYYVPASLGDRVWDDLDGDSVQDGGEPGFGSVTVTLTGGSLPPGGITDVTDASGGYDFTGLAPGTYTATLTISDLPAGVVNTFGGTAQVTTIESGDDENDIDFGFYVPAAIGDLVWDDLDGDGVRDPGEPGIPGVTVTLTGGSLPPGGITDDTDAAGVYGFSNLPPGSYTATVDTGDLAAGAVSTTGGFSDTTTIQSGTDDLTLDFGVANPITIGDMVFDDLDGDGVHDAGEPGLASVDVTITGPSHPGGTTVATDGTGFYEFTGLLPGSYTVDVDVADVPAGYTASSSISVTATYESGDDVDTVDFGFTTPADLGDFVWEDLDADGAYDAGEPGLAGVTLELSGPGVPPGTTVTTPASGAYSFGGLDPGTYTVTATGVPAGYSNTFGGPFQTTLLSSGESDLDLDFAFYLGASIGDVVFDDLDGDGVQDPGEPGFDGVTVSLFDGITTITQDTVNGAYDFTGLTPDTYTVFVDTGDLPPGAVNTLGGASQSFTVSSGDDEDGGDFGYYIASSVGDYVWDDLDGDGVQDDGPASTVGISGVDVTITGPGLPPGGTTVTTDANGAYDFTGLQPGTFTVTVDTADLAPGATSTTGGFTVGSIVVTSGSDIDTVDFGVANPASVGDLVYLDNNGNTVFDAGDAPLPGVTVTLTGPGIPPGTTDVTDGSGIYGFSGLLPGSYTATVTAGLPAGAFSTTGGDAAGVTLTSGENDLTIDFGYALPASIGDTLFHDLDGDGNQDAGEPGIADVDVTLTGPGQPPGGTTIPTGPTGAYAFTTLAPGTYTVTVETTDPDLDPAFVSTTGGDVQGATIVSAENLTTVDFGYTAPGSIGDFVFTDDDADGSQAGETGLGGVTVRLTGGTLPPAGITDVTDGAGAYLFSNVMPGDYTVTVESGLPAGAFSTTGGDSENVTISSGENDLTIDFGYAQPATIGDLVFDDLDGDGVFDPGEPGFPAVDVTITGPSHPGGSTVATNGSGGYTFSGLTPGSYDVTVDTTDLPAGVVNTLGGVTRTVVVGSNDTDLTADFGYYRPASIGDLVFEDLNGDGSVDVGEPGYDAVDVTITGPSHPGGLTVQTVNGAYDVTGLAPGSYDVTVNTSDLPAGAVNTLGGVTRTVVVASGDDHDDADFGYYEPASLGDYVWDDLNGDGFQNDGLPSAVGIAGVSVTVIGPSHPLGTTVVTDADGGYDVTGLAPGTYTVNVPLAGPLTGAVSTTGGTIQVFTITSGDDENGADFGVTFPASLGDTVFTDVNGNGVEEAGDTGIGSVDLTITGPSHPGGTTVTTDGSGVYGLGGLLPGSYTVAVDTADLPLGATSTTGGDSQVVVLQSGESDLDVDFGYVVPASLGDQLWIDDDADGVFDPGESGIADVDVIVTGPGQPPGGTIVSTGPTGTYGLSGLLPGSYTVTVDTTDPDFDPAWFSTTGGNAQSATIVSSDVIDTLDFGYAAPASVGDTVFDDLNGDGVQQPGELGLSGLTVTITGGDLAGPVVTTTNGTGTYGFSGLTPGAYDVTVTAPGRTSTTGGDTQSVTLSSGETDLTIDFGYVLPADLGDTVFHDLDDDGVQDPGEPGLAGITVTLTGPGVPPGTTDVTDGSGNYGFGGLLPGLYTVTVDTAGLPTPAYASTTGGDAQSTTLTSGESELGLDFGYAAPAQIGDLVWDDLDGDGAFDAGEPGFDGVTVTLDDGVSPPTTIDTIAGAYAFTNLAPGTYTVTVDLGDLPAGVVNTFGGASQTFTVDSAEVVDTADFGYYRPGSIGDLVFTDANGNGTFNVGDTGLDGVEVTLTGGGLGTPLVATTAGGGAYSFTGLAPGTYTATLTGGVPAGATSTTGGNSLTVTIVSGQDLDTVDFGLAQYVSVGDRVWHDLDDDGVQDGGEPGLTGVTMQLRDVTSTVIATDVTDAAGAYLFTNVAPGDYTVTVDLATVPAGYTPSTAESFPMTVTSGVDVLTADAGYVTTGSIGDFVWDDLNGDGMQDAGEPGIDGLTVTLTGGGLGGPVSVVTAGGGAYTFPGLDPGTYMVTVTPPVNGTSTTGGDAQAVTIASGEDLDTVDFGYAIGATIGDVVWHDLNADGVQDAGEPGIAGVDVLLTGPSGPMTATTDGAGGYTFAGLLPGSYTVDHDPATLPTGVVSGVQLGATTPGSVSVTIQSGDDVTTADFGFATAGAISGTIYEDDDADGVLEPGESGLGGVTMELVDGGGSVVATAVTAADGTYSFTGVAPGAYTVRVDGSTVPAGFSNTSPTSIPVTVVSDQAVTDVDVGYDRPSTIGDVVWHDLDADGVQDPGEPGLASIDVELVNGVGAVIATETTGAAGDYLFTGVDPGDYTVRVDLATLPVGVNSGVPFVATAGVPTSVPVTIVSGDAIDTVDFAFHTTAVIGDFVWHDLDADGAQDPGEPGLVVTVELVDGGTVVASTPTAADGSYTFTGVAPGTYEVRVTGVPAGYSSTTGNNPSTAVVVSDDSQLDFDFGFALLTGGSVGDLVWDDLDGDGVRDAGEPGIAGVTVDLLVGGVVTDTRVTPASGAYLFANLGPGTYEVRIDASTLPATYVSTTGGDSQSTTLLSGQSDLDLDFGYTAPAIVGDVVWHDLDGDGVQDPGEPGIAGVGLELVNGGGTVIDSATTDAAGAYSLTAPGPGDYTVRVVAATTPVGTNSGTTMTVTTADTFAVTLTSNEVRNDLDVGYTTTASIGDTIFDDLDGDGVQDPGEPGLVGVTVVLTDGGGPTTSVVTGANGFYEFSSLAPGTYSVSVDIATLPAGSVATTTSSPVVVTVVSDDLIDNVDLGYAIPASLAGIVFTDAAGDGSHVGDNGLGGVMVELLDDGGSVVGSMPTAVDGSYLFSGLMPGDYQVRPTVPAGSSLTIPNTGDDATDSDVLVATGMTDPITVVSGAAIVDVDAGVFDPATIGDLVWVDLDGDGVQDPGESGLGGVLVEVRDAGGALVAGVTTGADGSYSVAVDPGTYTASVSAPAGFVLPPAGGVSTTTVTSGQTDLDVDFPMLGTGGLQGQVAYDVVGDGTIDAVDPGHSGVVVTATWDGRDGIAGTSDDASFTTTTGTDGSYSFATLPPGSYVVVVDQSTLPDGLIDATVDPDATIDLVTSVPVAGTTVTGVDFATTGTASLGDNVFLDADNDGVLDPGEEGVGGVTVTATVTTSAGVRTFTAVTDSTGFYQFVSLPAGDYTVSLDATTIPVGLVPTIPSRSTTLVIGGTDQSLDLALIALVGPTAVDDRDETPSGTPVTVPVVVDNDIVIPGTSVTVTAITQPGNGTSVIGSDNTVVYTPHQGFAGTDTFTYTICDEDGLATYGDNAATRNVFCSTATVTITTPPPVPIEPGDNQPPPETTIPTPTPTTPSTPTTPATTTTTTTDGSTPDRPIPTTGANSAPIQVLAMAFLLAGLAMVFAGRRRRNV